jgi:hypothetical protein
LIRLESILGNPFRPKFTDNLIKATCKFI